MTPSEWATLLGVGVSLLAALFALIRGWRADKNAEKKLTVEERQTESDIRRAELAGNLELNRYIDEKVDREVKRQIAPLENRLAITDARAEKAEARADAGSRIVRATVLVWRPEYDVPDIDPADVVILGERVPTHWIRRDGAPKRI